MMSDIFFDKRLSHGVKTSIKMVHLYEMRSKNVKFPHIRQYNFNGGNSNSEILHRSVCDAETLNDQRLYT